MSKVRSEATRQAAVDLVRKGTPVSQVAKTYGVTQSGVRIWLKKAAAPVFGQTVSVQELGRSKPNLARVRDAIATLSEAGLI